MKYHFIVCGRDCFPWVKACLTSIASQLEGPFDVMVVDDASEDERQPKFIAEWCEKMEWGYRLNDERLGAMANQFWAWSELGKDATDDDVFIWVDLDDRLAHHHVIRVLRVYYRRGAWMTYGSYMPYPPSKTCPPVRPYPPSILKTGNVRDFIQKGGGLRFNHLRTVSWKILKHITEEDCKDDNGDWLMTGCDAAVMIPAIELAGQHCMMITDRLYVYNSGNPASDWRVDASQVNADHAVILAKTPKLRLT